ncbi:MAG: hypothetical protein RJA99_3224 [Pseudomonadota bacterium]
MITPPNNKGRRIFKINAFTQAKLVKLMLEGTYTCAELAEQTGLHYVTVLGYCRAFHREGAAHISMYEKDSRGRDSLKVYKIGPGKDAKRSKLTPAQRQERVRKRKQMAAMLGLTAGSPS